MILLPRDNRDKNILFFDPDSGRGQRRAEMSLRVNVAVLRAGWLRAAGLANKSEEKDDYVVAFRRRTLKLLQQTDHTQLAGESTIAKYQFL